jgi:putative oxidoreductase
MAYTNSDYAAFVLRAGLGIMYLAHSVVLKLMTFTLASTAGFFEKIGLPAWLAYVTFACEVAGGVLLILG